MNLGAEASGRRRASAHPRSEKTAVRLKIDPTFCQGHGRCHAAAPDVYPMDDEGYVAVASIDVPADQEEVALRGMHACPERAISINTEVVGDAPVGAER